MAYLINPAQINDIAKRDQNRLVGSVAKALAANSPFINVLRGGTFPSGVGDTVVAAVEMQAAPGDSLAAPTFTPYSQIAGTAGTQERTGKVDFTYRLEAKRGTGPKVAVTQGYSAFKTSYLAAEDALRKLITQYINADIQYQLVTKAATKAKCRAGRSLAALTIGGNETDIGIDWSNLNMNAEPPDAQLTFKALHAWARYLREALFGEFFPAGEKAQPHFRFIGSADVIESFREEVGVQNILIALTTGRYRLGEESVSGYSFETSPAYRGLAFGVTHRPLRCNDFDATGVPQFINPVTVVVDSTTNTAYAKPNPAWLSAQYEVGVLIADGAFERLVPEQYVGEGTFKFAPQLHGGELEWHYVKDNDVNAWGDYGFHKYQITRAYRPVRPQHIIPIIYKRRQVDLGLETIS